MPQDRKALASIEQTGDRRAKVPLTCIKWCLQHIALGIKSMLLCYSVEKSDEVKECA